MVVAKLTIRAGQEAVKATVPIGKWALGQGFKVAVNLVAKSLMGSKAGPKGKPSRAGSNDKRAAASNSKHGKQQQRKKSALP